MVPQWTDNLVVGIRCRERACERVPRWHAWRLWIWRSVVCSQARSARISSRNIYGNDAAFEGPIGVKDRRRYVSKLKLLRFEGVTQVEC